VSCFSFYVLYTTKLPNTNTNTNNTNTNTNTNTNPNHQPQSPTPDDATNAEEDVGGTGGLPLDRGQARVFVALRLRAAFERDVAGRERYAALAGVRVPAQQLRIGFACGGGWVLRHGLYHYRRVVRHSSVHCRFF